VAIVRIVVDVPLPRSFDYSADDATIADIGRLATVPFGRGDRTGVIVDVGELSDQAPEKIRVVRAIHRDAPRLPADWIALAEFCSAYYHHPLGEVMAMALPPLLRRGRLPRRRGAESDAKPAQLPAPQANAEQAAAIEAINACRGFAVFLLDGVTGSGKTEVYLQAIASTLARGAQALMLVPEIALTPQLEARVRGRFAQARVVAAHSGLTDAARARAFIDAVEGRADIVLGTRLAVFMPLPRLGLIVADEEHDASFKQQEGLRYSARDVAVFRAKQTGVPIVLGSATPSLETWQHARTGRYRHLLLSGRATSASLPAVRCVDTRREKLQEGMSQALLDAIAARLERGEQSLVFLNRRGYAPVLACPACGWISRCNRCAANLVVHLADRRLRCHHCGFETHLPRACPDCGNLDIHPFGRGTQRLETALAERFPQARISRVDRDSANTPKRWQAILDDVHGGRVDILVGTQMLAKGHDFPMLTLVGVVGADAALYAADFRAPERLFAQIMQVGGRSGRAALPGEVLIQTEYPEHPLYQALIDHDYARFAAAQLEERREAGFPPFAHQALLRAEAPDIAAALAFLAEARNAAPAAAYPAVSMYDPVPMRLYRRMNLERAQLLVESVQRPQLQAFLGQWMEALRSLKTPRDLRWHLDVDPLEF
jgi:primosomal protein N' (replication factor Y)